MDAVSAAGLPRSRVSMRCWCPPLSPFVFLLAGIAFLPLDIQIASFFNDNRGPGMLSEFLEICEVFGHGIGATLILIGVVVLDRPKLRIVPWLVTGSLGSGFVANLVKLLVHRARPRDFDLAVGSVWQTFSHAQATGGGMQSIPSAHTATATGLAIVLASLYPQGRWYFWSLAILVGVQRIATRAHFPSDVCAGAAVGCIVAMLVLKKLPR